MFEKKILTFLPYISSTLHSSYTKSYELVEGLKTIPQKWIEDLKHVEHNELLSSSIGPLALFFGWKRKHKEEFSEIASGILASSFVHGDPVGTISSVVVLAHKYSKIKNKAEFNNLKWGIIKGTASVGAFALTTKFISSSLFGFLFALCIAGIIRKTLGYIKMLEYLKYLKKFKPKLKKYISRRDFITLNFMSFKNA